jgi:hypothetical protein
VLLWRAGAAHAPRPRTALAAALAAIGHELPPEHESDGDAGALEEFLRAQPVPGASA